MVFDEAGLMADLVGEGSSAMVARGGRGGRGNASLASSRNRVPRSAEAGEPGEERRLSVELRVLADVGLVGLPNAGKSTLLGRLTAARPRVGVGAKAERVREPESGASRVAPDAVVGSGLTGEGIDRLADRVADLVEAASMDQEEERQPFVVLRPARPPFVVRKEGTG